LNGTFVGNGLGSNYSFQVFNGLALKDDFYSSPEGYYEPWNLSTGIAHFPSNVFLGFTIPGGGFIDGSLWVMYSDTAGYLNWGRMPCFSSSDYTNWNDVPELRYAVQNTAGGTRPDSFPWVLDVEGVELPNAIGLKQPAAVELVNKRLLVTDAGMRVDKNLVVHGRGLFDRERADVKGAAARRCEMGELQADSLSVGDLYATSGQAVGAVTRRVLPAMAVALINLRLTNGSGHIFTLGLDAAESDVAAHGVRPCP
jgi:hypothetical protein